MHKTLHVRELLIKLVKHDFALVFEAFKIDFALVFEAFKIDVTCVRDAIDPQSEQGRRECTGTIRNYTNEYAQYTTARRVG